MDTIEGWGGRDIPVAVHEKSEVDAGVVVVLPGSGYTPAHPLLHFTGEMFYRAGFTAFELWWGDTLEGWQDQSSQELAHRLGTDALAAADAANSYGPLAGFVTKSLGTMGLAAASTARPSLRDIPAVWLTPTIRNLEDHVNVPIESGLKIESTRAVTRRHRIFDTARRRSGCTASGAIPRRSGIRSACPASCRRRACAYVSGRRAI